MPGGALLLAGDAVIDHAPRIHGQDDALGMNQVVVERGGSLLGLARFKFFQDVQV